MNANPREMIGLTCWGHCENRWEESKREMKLVRVLGLVSLDIQTGDTVVCVREYVVEKQRAVDSCILASELTGLAGRLDDVTRQGQGGGPRVWV